MTKSLIAELAQRLGKTEDEVFHFFQTLWQVVPPTPELQPYFFRYLDERFLRLEDRISNLRQEMLLQIEGSRKDLHHQIGELQGEIKQGNAALLQQIEGLRKDMQQGDAALAQQIEGLRAEMNQQIEVLRKEMQHNSALLQQQIDALKHHIERVEKWLFALTIPVLVSTLGILVMLFKPL